MCCRQVKRVVSLHALGSPFGPYRDTGRHRSKCDLCWVSHLRARPIVLIIHLHLLFLATHVLYGVSHELAPRAGHQPPPYSAHNVLVVCVPRQRRPVRARSSAACGGLIRCARCCRVACSVAWPRRDGRTLYHHVDDVRRMLLWLLPGLGGHHRRRRPQREATDRSTDLLLRGPDRRLRRQMAPSALSPPWYLCSGWWNRDERTSVGVWPWLPPTGI